MASFQAAVAPGRVRSWSAVAVLMAAVLGSSGCSRVAAYERGRLAHPTLRADYQANPAAAHVHAVHEGARGGGSSESNGCGCN